MDYKMDNSPLPTLPTLSVAIEQAALPPKKKYNYTKKTGRPIATKYERGLHPNWKNLILQWSAQGLSKAEMTAKLCWNGKRFNHTAWNELEKIDDEFSVTIRKAMVLSEAWWTNAGRKALNKGRFQAFVWFCNMKNRFGWKDKLDVGGEFNVNHTLSDLVQAVRAAEASAKGMARITAN